MTDLCPIETEAPDAPEPDESEASRELLGMAEGCTGAIPADLVVRHVLRVTEGGDWYVQRAAFEAFMRRFRAVERDRLRVSQRPAGGEPFGLYQTRRVRSRERPYQTLLERMEPLVGSCDCPDFLRGSLGACKHLLTVLEDVCSRPRKIAAALRSPGAGKPAGPRLSWDPVKPLHGPGDWLERVRLDPGRERPGRRPASAAVAAARRRFTPADNGLLELAETYPDRPRRRLALLDALRPLLRQRRAAQTGTSMPQPALRALFAQEAHRLELMLSCRESSRSFQRSLRTMKRALYDYQREGVRRMLQTGRLLLADDMGLGKTAQAIAACHVLWRTGKTGRGIIIVPASLKGQWLREWTLFTDVPARVVEGSPDERIRTYRTHRRGFLIVNYEQVLRDLHEMTAWKPDIVVLDEAQRIKNWATKTASCVKRLDPPYRLVLTGTPLENRLDELASILDWVDDDVLQPKWRLAPWHTIHEDGGRQAIGARNLDTIRTRLAPCMMRRVRHDVLDQLPGRTDTTIPVELSDAQAEEHAALATPIARLAAVLRRRPLSPAESIRLISLLTTQRIIANGLAQLHFTERWPEISGAAPTASMLKSLDCPKLVELREMLAQLVVGQRRKVVVFSQWRRMLRLAHWAVGDLLAANDLRAAFFTGAESQRRRNANLVNFHDDPAVAVLFATDAGGVGLNLQRAANCVINLDVPWNPAVLEQRIGRIHRIGQKDPIDVYDLISQACIEQRIAALVGDKKALFTGLFDGTSDEVQFDRVGSFMSAVTQIVEPAAVPDLVDDEDESTESVEEAERRLDEIIDDADESRDAPPVEPPARLPARLSEQPPAGLPANEVEMKTAGMRDSVTPPVPDVDDLFSRIEFRRRKDGGVSIEAPAEAAETLASMFEAMAGMLRAAPERRSRP